MSDEWFDIVDNDDQVIGRDTRRNAHTVGHIHRSVMFFLFDRRRRVFANQRSMSKEFYPGYWSIVLGGHVPAGESYESAVIREAKEEADVDAIPFLIGTFHKRFDSTDRENVHVFGFVLTGQPLLDPLEVQRGRFSSFKELEEMMGREHFLPETQRLLPLLRDWLNGPGHNSVPEVEAQGTP